MQLHEVGFSSPEVGKQHDRAGLTCVLSAIGRGQLPYRTCKQCGGGAVAGPKATNASSARVREILDPIASVWSVPSLTGGTVRSDWESRGSEAVSDALPLIIGSGCTCSAMTECKRAAEGNNGGGGGREESAFYRRLRACM